MCSGHRSDTGQLSATPLGQSVLGGLLRLNKISLACMKQTDDHLIETKVGSEALLKGRFLQLTEILCACQTAALAVVNIWFIPAQ